MPGPLITMDDIRMFLIDRNKDDNFLLDDVEFDDKQLMSAMQWVVDEFNETPPLITLYTVENFPFRNGMIVGAAGYLLQSAAMNYLRNHLDYQNKSGTAVSDTARWQGYLAMAKGLKEEYKGKIKNVKISMNVESCYDSIGSPYSQLWAW